MTGREAIKSWTDTPSFNRTSKTASRYDRLPGLIAAQNGPPMAAVVMTMLMVMMMDAQQWG